MKFTINGLDWTIGTVPVIENNDHALGRTYYDTLHILIKGELQPTNRRKIIIHEITHAMIYSVGLDQVKLNDEIMCDFISVYAETILNIVNKIEKGEQELRNEAVTKENL